MTATPSHDLVGITMQPASVPRVQLQRALAGEWLSKTVLAALRLGIIDAISPTAVTSSNQLASRLGLDAAALYRLLRALAANGIFEELPDRSFQHTELSRELRHDHPASLRAMVMLSTMSEQQAAWNAVDAAVSDGVSAFNHANGAGLFEFLAKNPGPAQIFNDSMVSISLQVAPAIAKAFPFYRYQSVADIGGGLGHLLAAILREYPAITGTVFDLPYVERAAIDYLQKQNVGERAQFTGGSFLETVPNGPDVFVIKNVLWNWNDENAGRILRNIRRSLGDKKGRLLIVETLIAPETQAYDTLFDVCMLVMTPGGRARTTREYCSLAGDAGFRLASSTAVQEITVLEFEPHS